MSTPKHQKKISFSPKPTQKVATLDEWVDPPSLAPHVATPAPKAIVESIETVRLTIDLSKDLHTKFKLHCVGEGRKIAEVMRELIERELGLS